MRHHQEPKRAPTLAMALIMHDTQRHFEAVPCFDRVVNVNDATDINGLRKAEDEVTHNEWL